MDVLKGRRDARWLVLMPLALGGLISVLAYRPLPRYQAEARVGGVVQHPSASDRSAVHAIDNRLQSFSDQVLSRSHLLRIVDDFGLYKELRVSGGTEQAVQRMRGDIDVIVDRDDASYRVVYISTDPAIARLVTERIAALYVEASLPNAGNRSSVGRLTLRGPVSVGRPRLQSERLAVLIGAPLGGLALGVLLVRLLERRGSTFTCEHDVARLLSIPVLALIPSMESRGPHAGASGPDS